MAFELMRKLSSVSALQQKERLRACCLPGRALKASLHTIRQQAESTKHNIHHRPNLIKSSRARPSSGELLF
jgi:hypothetical protein